MTDDSNYLILQCPHCECFIYLSKSEINCGIFRHAQYIGTFVLIDPHCPQEQCEKLVSENKVYGCGKPCKLDPLPYDPLKQDIDYKLIKCDYI